MIYIKIYSQIQYLKYIIIYNLCYVLLKKLKILNTLNDNRLIKKKRIKNKKKKTNENIKKES